MRLMICTLDCMQPVRRCLMRPVDDNARVHQFNYHRQAFHAIYVGRVRGIDDPHMPVVYPLLMSLWRDVAWGVAVDVWLGPDQVAPL